MRAAKCWAAAVQVGIAATSNFYTGDNEGVGYYRVNQKNGWRRNASRGLLRPIRSPETLKIETGAHVERIEFDGKRATGIRYRWNGQTHLATASAEVILSAGAIGSPQILQLSSIGPGPLLQRLGIKIRNAADSVGRNLKDHLQLRCNDKVKNAQTLNTASANLWGKAKIGLEYALRRSGPMSMSPSKLGAFARSNPDEATPNLQYHIQPLSLEAFGQELHPFDTLTASVCNLRPESRGHVALISPDPHFPLISVQTIWRQPRIVVLPPSRSG